MTTGAEVVTELNSLFSDTANSRFTAGQKLAAVNRAIGSAFPDVWVAAVDTSATLASSTYEYSPTATPEGGFRVAYVTLDNNPKVLLRGVRQRQTGVSTFVVMVPGSTASEFAGETLHLQYAARAARLAAVDDTISAVLNLDYLVARAAAALCLMAPVKGAQYDVDQYQPLYAGYMREALEEKRALAASLKPLPQMIDVVADHGLDGDGPGRYGQNIIP